MAAPVSHPIALTVPDPEATDSEAVAEGLLAARSELARGQPREALRLVRQAAEACDELGNDLRALALARFAADLANEVASLPPPPSQLGAAPSQRAAVPATELPASLPPPPAPRAAPAPSQRAEQAAPAPSQRAEQAAPAPSQRAEQAAPAPSQRTEQAAVDPELAALLSSGRAVRVLVKRSARDAELYVVRQPVDGKPVYDAREAVIVLLEPDAAFFGAAGNGSPLTQ